MSMVDPSPGTQLDPVEGDNGRTWRRISDFRPGIHTQVSPTRPPGVAQVNGTFGCYAATTGSLIPAPRMVRKILPPTGLIDANAVTDQYRIGGIFANAPVYSIDSTNPNTSGAQECHTELFMATEYWTATGMDLRVYRYTRNKLTPEWELVWQRWIGGTYSATTRPRAAFFGSQRSNSADPDSSGPQVVAWVYSGNARYFPADTDTFNTATAPLPADEVGDPQPMVAPSALTTHQGRVIVFPLYVTGDGDDQVYVSSEAAYWTDVNDASTLDANLSTYFTILGGYENASGYAVIAPITANELFLVKIRGGALFIYGDLDSPSEVRTLPMVQSAGMSLCNGTTTSYGHIYPVDTSGIWMYTGGDSSQHITKHLYPDFWRPNPVGPAYTPRDDQTAREYGHSNLQMATWNEFALLPSWWMWDSDEKGWWRLMDPNHPDIPECHRWQTDERGIFAWAAPAGFSNTSNPVMYEFSRIYGATYFTWTSHPQNHTIDAQFSVDELVVCGQGNGKVRVTVQSDVDRHDPISVEVEFSDDDRPRPVKVRCPKLSGSSFTFQIESIGADHDEGVGSWDPNASKSAPTIHWVDYSLLPNNKLRTN